MSEPIRASGRAVLRPVDLSESVPADPFARPVFDPTGPPRLVNRSEADAEGVCEDEDIDDIALVQSSRIDYSLRWTETGIAVPPPPEAVGDWPSDRWAVHLAGCGPVRRCRHRVPEPAWWVLMAGRGIPLHEDAVKARAAANHMINKFRSQPVLPPEMLALVHGIVRDAMVGAPQPITEAWMKSTLAMTASLVRSVAVDGGPLTREHVLSKQARNRFLYVHLAEYQPNSVSGYRSRLELVDLTLSGVTIRQLESQPKLKDSIPQTPLTWQEEASLFPWAQGLRTQQRRQRMSALVVLGLGVGPMTPEILLLRSDDFVVDSNGVHVTITATDGRARVVTCRREWEERLVALLDATAPGHYLVAPWRDTPPTEHAYHQTVWNAQEKDTPPTYFNAGRLRNTWLVRHMERGELPLKALLEAANLQTITTIYRLLPHCEEQTSESKQAAMRGHSS